MQRGTEANERADNWHECLPRAGPGIRGELSEPTPVGETVPVGRTTGEERVMQRETAIDVRKAQVPESVSDILPSNALG